MAIDILQRMAAGSRASCFFDGESTRIDASAMCHEVRGVTLAPGERVVVSFCDADARRDVAEAFASPGELCSMTDLKIQAVIVMRIWACLGRPSKSASGPAGGYAAADFLSGLSGSSGLGAQQRRDEKPRLLGEVRLPLHVLATRCDGALYHTWLLLEEPAAGNDGARELTDEQSFGAALLGSEQDLFKPKACLSLVRTVELDGQSRVLWQPDMPHAQRISRWGPLMRSQAQHESLCALEFRESPGSRSESSRHSEDLSKLQQQELENRALLLQVQSELDSCRRQEDNFVAQRASETKQEAKRERELAERLQKDLEQLQRELLRVGEEANTRIGTANDNIRALRKERDVALADLQQQKEAHGALADRREKAALEKAELIEQKEALLQIVEDLHQACSAGGLGDAGRKSVESLFASGLRMT
eukprot:TRINITY_DN91462_c0_g1_i1.p1 TRINITY_DN91462_c0_g1~~TRINITY_DN91462_c0_g1_i1.p1  ORF type:complete len:420 (+),score=94.07 TRINITY_DN91462_c0_g1_i1:131-1390(+)